MNCRPPEAEAEEKSDHPKLAIVGRPNVGKSTLVNAILGEERVIAFDQPGTTRDSIYIDFERDGKQYTIIDTAGVRRRGKVDEAVEKFSVVKDAAGHRRCQRGGAGGGCARPDHRAGCAPCRFCAASRTCAGAGGEQVGRAGRIQARHDQARYRTQAAFPEFCQAPLHFRAERHAAWMRC